jgi:hypothetical protein
MDLVDLKSGSPVYSHCGLLAALWVIGFGGRVVKSNRRLNILLVTRWEYFSARTLTWLTR